MDDDAIYVADVGQNQLWSADNYVMKNGRFLTSGGMGTMGYSIPAGIGAKMCTPDKQVVVVCGDGSFQMSMYELGTIAVNKVPIKILVMRNHYLGLVREHQEKTYEEHYSVSSSMIIRNMRRSPLPTIWTTSTATATRLSTQSSTVSSPATRPASWSAKSTATTTQNKENAR